MASLLDARSQPLDRTKEVRVNAYRTAKDDDDRKRAAEEQALLLNQQAADRANAEEARRAAENAQKQLLPVATADVLQWTAQPEYQKPWAQQPQEMRDHLISAYGPGIAAQAPSLVNKAVGDNTGRIPGLDPDLEHAGTVIDEKGERREQYSRPTKVTGEITEAEVAKEGIDPGSIAKKDWPAAIAKARAGREGKMTEMQSNALQYSARMKYQRGILEELEKNGYDPSVAKNAAAGSQWIPNVAKTGDQQSYVSARDNWVAAVLRKESGAAISEAEYKNAYKQYFPQWGDSPEVIKQKADLRRITEDNMRLVAGGKVVDAETGPVLPPAANQKQLSPADQAAIDWANANPNDPRAARIKAANGAK